MHTGLRERTGPAVSVVIPTRHEARSIGAFLDRAAGALRGLDSEIVVVDDSDHDNTVDALEDAKRRFGERLVVLHRPKGSVPERSLGTAVVTGIRAARGTYVCVMDADGQHPPEAIPAMLAAARRTSADYVGGSRYVPGGSAEGLDGFKRKFISRGLALVARLAFCHTPIRRVTDPLSGFFLFRRALVAGVDLQPIGWKISLEVLVRGGARRITEVPYRFAKRADGDSKATLQQGLLVLRHMFVLLSALSGPRRLATFGAVGLSGVVINTGLLLLLAAAGFDALSWPVWIAAEAAIIWNFHLNRRLTWRERGAGKWYSYNLSAAAASVIAIQATRALVLGISAPLPAASLIGTGTGMALNFLLADRLVFVARRPPPVMPVATLDEVASRRLKRVTADLSRAA